MRLEKFVPLTLESVGSEGKFFTDKVILKIIGALFAGGYIGLVVYGQLSLLLPAFITVPVGAIVGLFITILIVRYWVLKERMLIKLFKIMDRHKVIETSEFCDIYTITDSGVCMHESGHVSATVEINLATTVGLDTKAIDHMYRCFEMFESQLLLAGVSFKTYGIEFTRKTFEELDEQQVKLSYSNIPNLANTMRIRNKYIRTYTQEVGKLDKTVYVVYSDKHDEQHLVNLVKRVEPLFRHPAIHSFELLDTYAKLNKFGEEFFLVNYFNIANDSDDDLIDIIKFEEV